MANPKIEKMARAMAIAEGHNPDQLIDMASSVLGETRGVRYAEQPAWQYYVAYARITLAGIRAEREPE